MTLLDDPVNIQLTSEAGPGLEVVRAGVNYQELDAFRRAELESYLVQTRVRESAQQPQQPSQRVINHREQPDSSIYRPLDGSQDIRVLELLPGEFEDPICCTLQICSVAFEYPSTPTFRYPTVHSISCVSGQPVWYTALSYTWGDTALTKPLVCSGKTVYTTKNLDGALHHLRRPDAAVMLWIDQICINQNDLDEKSLQVMLMGKVYQHAWNTVVWLGEEADNSDDAFELLEKILYTFQTYTDESAPQLEDFGRLSLPAPGSATWVALNKLLGRPWFQRTWVIQEIVLSNRIQIMCGERCLSWMGLSLFANCMMRHDLTRYLDLAEASESQNSQSGCLRIFTMENMKSYHESFLHQATLLANLVEARGGQATDPRDKVYAIMGLSSKTIYPDYKLGVYQLYTQVASTITSDDMIDYLCCVDHSQPIAGLPSWVPDWSSARQTTSLGYLRMYAGVYRAALGPKTEIIRDSDNSLKIVGIIFDAVAFVSVLAGRCLEDLQYPSSHTSQFVLESMNLAISYCQRYLNSSGLFNAFWRTLVAGRAASGYLEAPSDYAAIFLLLIDTVNECSPSLPDQLVFKWRLTLDSLKVRSPSRIYRQMQLAFEAAVKGRVFGTTMKRYMGLLPRGARPGDKICVFLGGHIPFVIRQQGTSSMYQLIGECYVHGVMDGELMDMRDLQTQDIKLV